MRKRTFAEIMVITFLGTGTSQGVPVIGCDCRVCSSDDTRDQRLRTSLMINLRAKTLIIDTGPDFRQQMLREKVRSLDAVLITHSHKDHIGGLDDIRAYNFMLKKPVDLYCSEDVETAIQQQFPYAFGEKKYPGAPVFNIHTIKNNAFSIDDIEIIPVEVLHFKMNVFGFRIEDFTYITDANFISFQELQKIKGSKVIVINGLRKAVHYSHFNLEQAVALLSSLKPDKAYITHISHLMGNHEEVGKELPDFINLAYDGLKVEV